MFVSNALTDDTDEALILTPNPVCTGQGFRPRVPIGDALLRNAQAARISHSGYKQSRIIVKAALPVKPPNETIEAYTGNHVGHKGDRTP